MKSVKTWTAIFCEIYSYACMLVPCVKYICIYLHTYIFIHTYVCKNIDVYMYASVRFSQCIGKYINTVYVRTIVSRYTPVDNFLNECAIHRLHLWIEMELYSIGAIFFIIFSSTFFHTHFFFHLLVRH